MISNVDRFGDALGHVFEGFDKASAFGFGACVGIASSR